MRRSPEVKKWARVWLITPQTITQALSQIIRHALDAPPMYATPREFRIGLEPLDRVESRNPESFSSFVYVQREGFDPGPNVVRVVAGYGVTIKSVTEEHVQTEIALYVEQFTLEERRREFLASRVFVPARVGGRLIHIEIDRRMLRDYVECARFQEDARSNEALRTDVMEIEARIRETRSVSRYRKCAANPCILMQVPESYYEAIMEAALSRRSYVACPFTPPTRFKALK